MMPLNARAGQGRVPEGAVATWRFGDPGLLGALESAPAARIDDLGFGLVVMNRDGDVTAYNQAESALSGLPAVQVAGRNFFVEIGPCTNNYLIAQRFHDAAGNGAGPGQPDLDEQLDYVFTYRMSPTPVRRRLMARPGSARQYLAVRLR
jgi:photoactive yellow protein